VATVNADKVISILSHLEASSEVLYSIKDEMESTRPSPPVHDYYQILWALTQVGEAKERLEGVIKNQEES
jgi:hypothetical protein